MKKQTGTKDKQVIDFSNSKKTSNSSRNKRNTDNDGPKSFKVDLTKFRRNATKKSILTSKAVDEIMKKMNVNVIAEGSTLAQMVVERDLFGLLDMFEDSGVEEDDDLKKEDKYMQFWFHFTVTSAFTKDRKTSVVILGDTYYLNELIPEFLKAFADGKKPLTKKRFLNQLGIYFNKYGKEMYEAGVNAVISARTIFGGTTEAAQSQVIITQNIWKSVEFDEGLVKRCISLYDIESSGDNQGYVLGKIYEACLANHANIDVFKKFLPNSMESDREEYFTEMGKLRKEAKIKDIIWA